MLSLDEAIAHAREVANEQKRRSGICVQNDSECDKFSSCLKCAEEHEQIAEWLEKLKDYRDKTKMVVRIDCVNSEEFKGMAVKLAKEQYNKAIADFADKLKENISESLIWGMIVDCFKYKNMNDTSDKIVDYVIDTANEIAEQLKAGGLNE